MTDKNFNCVRPECYFDVVEQKYFNLGSNNNPEHMFTRQGVTYSYEEDFGKWNHIEQKPIINPPDAGRLIAENGPTDLHRVNTTYGFDYTSRFGVGNPLFVWYTNTDLEIETMKEIRNLRWPIIKKVKEAKEKEDQFKKWKLYNFIKNNYPESTIAPPEGTEVFCEEVKELIDDIPLECKIIEENQVLGSDYSGTDMNNYWWYGWLPSDYLTSNDTLSVPDLPFSGSTLSAAGEGVSILNSGSQTPPYQTSIGSYSCSDIELNPEGEIELVDGTNRPPYYGVYGGFTADPCGCVEVSDENLPSYITECNFPNYGSKYNEYLEYVRSVDARFWNTPKETPLYRKAQMVTLMSQKVSMVVPGDLRIKAGTIIRIKIPKSNRGSADALGGLDVISGKYLVLMVKHSFENNHQHTSKLTLVRDTVPE